MNNNIVQHFFRGEDEPPVEIKVACTAAASPPGLLFPDGDAAVGDAHDAGIIFCLAGEDIPCDFDVAAAVFCRERRMWGSDRLLLFFQFFCAGKVFQYPALVFRDESIDIGTGAAPGRAHEYAAVARHLDCDGFPAAVYDLIFKRMVHDSTFHFFWRRQFRRCWLQRERLYYNISDIV